MTYITSWDGGSSYDGTENANGYGSGISLASSSLQVSCPESCGTKLKMYYAPVGARTFVNDINAMTTEAKKRLQMKKGTTTLAFQFQGGILVAVDSRASMGSLISSQTVRKAIEINSYLIGTMAGGAADCAFWERYLGMLCRIHELRAGERITVAHASNILADIFYRHRGYGLSCGIMLAGYDSRKKEGALYYIDDSGSRQKGKMFSVGSGSGFALGVLDTGYRYDLTVDEAQELGRRAIFHAGHRDSASGGVVRIYLIKETGHQKLTEADDIAELYRHYRPPSASVPHKQP